MNVVRASEVERLAVSRDQGIRGYTIEQVSAMVLTNGDREVAR